MEYLIVEDIYLINEMSIQQHGGNFNPPKNLLNAGSVEYVVEAVQSIVFGQEAYPSVADKAGLYMFSIISNHAFSDGNKRTGLEAALLFLRINKLQLLTKLNPAGLQIEEDLPRTKHLEVFTLLVASAQIDLPQVQTWFAANIKSIR